MSLNVSKSNLERSSAQVPSNSSGDHGGFRRRITPTGALLLFANVSYWMCAGAYTPFLSAYFTSIGLSATEIGVLLTISPIAIICIQPFWARLSDATGKPKIVLGLIAAAASVAALGYYSGHTFTSVMLAAIVFETFYSALLPLCDALVIRGCGDYGVEFAYVRMGGTLGYAFIVFVVGAYLDRAPQAQFALLSCLVAVFLVSVLLLPRVKDHTRKDNSCSHEGDATEDLESVDEPAATIVRFHCDQRVLGIFNTYEVLFVLAFAFVSQMGIGFAGNFLGRYAMELGYGQGFVGVLNAVSALSELPILFFAHKIVERFGVMSLLAFACVMTVARLVLIGTGLVPAMIAGQLLQSVTYMTVYYCCTRYAAEAALPGRFTQGQSVLVLVQSGLAVVVANLSGGIIGDMFGMRTLYLLSAALVLASTIIVFAGYRAWRASFAQRRTFTAASERHNGSGQAVRR